MTDPTVPTHGVKDEQAPAGLPVRSSSEHKDRKILFWVLSTLLACLIIFVGLAILGSLIPNAPSPLSSKGIGIVEITGLIMDSKKINEQINEFVERKNISAIVLRIDSPGGGIVPSQEIFEEILKAKEKKKVITSMGSVAASGGYYIASASDVIVASSGTITGSIGVLMKFTNLEQIKDWAKLKTFNLKSGPYKDIGSPDRAMTDKDREILQSIIDEMQEQFIGDIARGRDMKPEEIRKLADGRIYTGNKAQALGLIDEIGNLEDSIGLAAKMVGIKGKPEAIYPDPEKKSFIRHLMDTSAENFFGSMFQSLQTTEFPQFFYLLNT